MPPEGALSEKSPEREGGPEGLSRESRAAMPREPGGGGEGVPLLPGGARPGPGARAGRCRGGAMPRAAALAGAGPLLFGYTMGFTSPIEVALRAAFPGLDWPVFAALVLVGACAGSLVAPASADALGRRRALQLCGAAPAALGWAAISAGTSLGGMGSENRILWLYAGRLASGLGIGAVSAVCPLYLAEASPSHLRGLYGSTFQLGITLGIVLAYIAGCREGSDTEQGVPLWRGMAFGGLALAVGLAVAMEFVPESPRWLLCRQVRGSWRAREALLCLRGPDAPVEEELAAMEEQLLACASEGAASEGLEEGGSRSSAAASLSSAGRLGLRQVLQDRALLFPVFIGVSMQMFQQFSGINSFIMFTGSVVGSPRLGVLIMATQVLATTASFAVVDRAGRRPMLVASSLLMAASSAALALLFRHVPAGGGEGQAHPSLPAGSRLTAAGIIVLYIIGFSLGLGPIPWTLNGELFPARIRAFASSLATLTNWLCACLSVWSFDRLQRWSPSGTFWLYAGACALCSAFVSVLVPETRGKSLEEIEQSFRQGAAGRGKSKSP